MKIIAHRGGATIYPEQTIISAKLAMDKGADLIELDVRFTKDKKIAVSHDSNAKRVFGKDKEIADMSAEEFLSLRHVENPAFSSHLFEDYLRCGIKKLLIHIKEDDVVDDLLKCIDAHDYSGKVVFGVHSTLLVKKIKAYNPNLKVLAFVPKEEDVQKFGETDVDYIRLWEHWITEENIECIRKFHKEIWIMTRDTEVGVTTREKLKKIVSMKVDGILMNDVDFLKEVMDSKIEH